MGDITDRVNRAIIVVGNIDHDIARSTPTMSTDEMVSLGQRLWWLSKRINKALVPIKSKLRDVAVLASGGTLGPIRMESPDGCHVTVVIQPEVMVIRKGVDVSVVKATLGDKFDMAFETTVTYKLRKDVQLCLSGMSESDIATIMSVVDASDMTPKVAFKD